MRQQHICLGQNRSCATYLGQQRSNFGPLLSSPANNPAVAETPLVQLWFEQQRLQGNISLLHFCQSRSGGPQLLMNPSLIKQHPLCF